MSDHRETPAGAPAKKSRRFHINIVDLACLLILVLLVAGVGYKLLGSKVKDAVEPTTTMTTVMRVRGVYPYSLKWLQDNDLTGSKLVMGTGYVDDAYITAVSFEPYTLQEVTADGEIVTATDPAKMDVVFTVQSQVAKNAAILKIGTQEVRTGRTFTLKTRTFEMNCNIDSVVLG